MGVFDPSLEQLSNQRTYEKRTRAWACGRFCILKRILEIVHVKTKLSLFIYLTTKKISAISEREHAHRSQKCTCVAVFSHAQLFSHRNMQTSRIWVSIENCRHIWKMAVILAGTKSDSGGLDFYSPLPPSWLSWTIYTPEG